MRKISGLLKCLAVVAFALSSMAVAYSSLPVSDVAANPCPNDRCR